MIINVEATYTSYHWSFLAFICLADTPQAELAQKTMNFNCVCYKVKGMSGQSIMSIISTNLVA